MKDFAYRDSLVRCADRYIGMINDQAEVDQALLKFTYELRHRAFGQPAPPYFSKSDDPLPLLKLNRWLGYIQGVLIERAITTVEVERDWTRPLFRPLDFMEPTFCSWSWTDDDTAHLRGAFEFHHNEKCSTEALYRVAAEAIRLWSARGMPGLNQPKCPSKS